MKKVLTLILLVLLPLSVAAYTLGRVSVHDPSIVWEPTTATYYIFGSHRGAAKTTDLMNWTAFKAPWGTSSSVDAANAEAFTTNQITSITIGEVVKNFGPFNAYAYSAAIATSSIDGKSWESIDGNMWAPDVIWNPNMEKWCMYLSLNGIQWNSSVILLTADNIEGPYTYQGPIVFSGFNVTDNEATSYKNTDLELVLGEQASLPERYAKGNNWGTYWPHCIDPCVFYDANDNLWLTYGSWSGGIYILRLNKNTGLRDYDYTYELTYSDNDNEETVLSDPYFGKKIAGGCYVSGEGSYIERIGNYYYLFMSYGFYDSVGGYQMRVFRSSNPDGPYTDPWNGDNAAIFSSYRMNYGSSANSLRGEYIFGSYGDWGNIAKGAMSERSQGHNSIIEADGRTYLVYHTKFQNWGESHQVRVHQVFQNQDGWLVAAPFEYTGETVTNANITSTQQIATADIPGNYKLLVHRDKLNYKAKEIVTPVEIELKNDGSITGEYTGSWELPEGTNSYVNITLGSTTYKGVMIEQTMEPGNDKVIAFTAMSSSNGINIWGHKYTPVVDEPITSGYDFTTGLQAYYNFDASPIANTENEEQTVTLQQEGTNTIPVLQTDSERSGMVIHTMFGANGNTSNAKFVNPLYNQTLDDGATLAFWVNPIEVNQWDALFGFYSSEVGRLYMTGNNYVGYNHEVNSNGEWIDNNFPNSFTSYDITYGKWNFITVSFSRTEGVKVYVDGVLKPFAVTAKGSESFDFNNLMVELIKNCPDFYFGYGSWWGSANALFDELLFYNRPLTATDAKALYQKEKADSKFLEGETEEPVVVPTPVYFNDFASTAGVTVIGSGEFITDDDPHFGKVYHNDPSLKKQARSNYLVLPASVLTHSGTTKEMTIGFWVNAMNAQDFWSSPIFTAYESAEKSNTWPMFAAWSGGTIQANCWGYCDFGNGLNDKGTNAYDTYWMDDRAWHYYTITLTSTKATVYIDGVVKNSWTVNGTDGQVVEGVFTGGAANALAYVCLGGNQPWGGDVIDPAFAFDDFAVYDVALTAEQIAQVITNKNEGVVPVLTYNYTVTASYGGNTKTLASGTGESGSSVTVAYPRYILDGTTLYEAAANNKTYNKVFTLSSDNHEEVITYNASTTDYVYYYAEGEDVLSGETSDLASASNGKLGGRQKKSSNYTELVTLPAGTWQISTAVYVGNSGDHTVNFKVGDEVKWSFTKGATYGWYNATSGNIVLTKAATVSVAVDGGQTTGIDWIYIKSAEPFEVVGAKDFTTSDASSADYTLRKGETRVFTFQNHGQTFGNNWRIIVKEGETKAITRADFWDNILSKHLDADGNDDVEDWALMSTDGGATKTNVNWDSFAEDMANARVVATVSYSAEGQLTINAVSTGEKNGYQYFVDNVGHVTGTGDMTVCLSVSNSWLEVISVSSDYEPVVLALKDKADNADAISANSGATVNVKLDGRTLVRTGDWNTLTLPFSVADISGTPLAGATIKELDATASGLDAEGVMTLMFKTATAIEAGKPYIVKWTDANLSNITDPLFTGVQITTTEPVAVTFSNNKGTGDCEFVGQFKPFAINSENINEIIFLGSGNRLGYSQNARNLNSFRAHFRVPSADGKRAMSRGIIDFGDGTTAIISPSSGSRSSDDSDRWYSIDGRRLTAKPTSKGIYINRNGKKMIKD